MINYADIYGETKVAGIAIEIGTTFQNLKNYGKITATKGDSAGILTSFSSGIIKNCQNYGEIDCQGGEQVGGIVCSTYSKSQKQIINCQNYGYLKNKNGVGGIVGNISDTTEIIDCANYGKVKGSWLACGEIVGATKSTYSSGMENIVTIKNCVASGESGYAIIGQAERNFAYGNKPMIVIIQDVKYNGSSEFESLSLVTAYSNHADFYISNLEADINVSNLYFYGKESWAIKRTNLIENVIIKNGRQIQNTDYLNNKNLTFEFNKAMVISAPNLNIYYGSDFSDFRYSWKDDKIYLKSSTSTSMFVGFVTEEWLINSKGYVVAT